MASVADEILVRSPFMRRVTSGDTAVIWHSLFGNPQTVSTDTLELIDCFDVPRPLDHLDKSFELDTRAREGLATLHRKHFLVDPSFNERAHFCAQAQQHVTGIARGASLYFLSLIMTEECNFRCSYCIHFENLERSPRIGNPIKSMSLETACKTVDLYVAMLRRHRREKAVLNFGGGEPLLNWTVLSRVLDYINERYLREFEWRFTINTNASLITPEVAAKLRRFNVHVASSLDGKEQGNNLVRIRRNGVGTYKDVLRGFRVLADAGHPIDGFTVTVNEHNFHLLDEQLIDWALGSGMNDVRIDIDVIGLVRVPLDIIVSTIMRLRRHGLDLGVEVHGFWLRAAENLNYSMSNEHVGFCGAVKGNNMCVNGMGQVYACGYSTRQLGDIADLDEVFQGSYRRFVSESLTGHIELCRDCMIEGQCGGGCVITHEVAEASRTDKVDRMCDFYRAMMVELMRERLESAR